MNARDTFLGISSRGDKTVLTVVCGDDDVVNEVVLSAERVEHVINRLASSQGWTVSIAKPAQGESS